MYPLVLIVFLNIFFNLLKQECATCLLSLPEVSPVVSKCRTLVSLIHQHPTALASLHMQEPELQVRLICIILDCFDTF